MKKRSNKRYIKKLSMQLKIVIALLIVCAEMVVFCSGYFVGTYTTKKGYEEAKQQLAKENGEITGKSEAELRVEEIMAEMTLSDMVYQMMFVTPESITKVGTVVRAGDATKAALEKYPVGGIVYFAKNFESREQTIAMLKATQEYSKIPLFLSVDEEGGRVSRLGSNSVMGVTKQPAMRVIGDGKDPGKAYEVGTTLGKELRELGFNVDFAPVADVIVNSKNSEIGDRSFGTDPTLVSEMVASCVKGLQEQGLSAALKHFPGHGSTYVDSHTGYSASGRTIEELRENEFLPFKAGIDENVDFIMVSHMTLVNATEAKLPSSMSEEVITGMLIGELGYKGIVITDSYSMGAITKNYSSGDAAVNAVKAGVDMVLMPYNLEEAHGAIVKAVESGEISEERIKESVRKILLTKYRKNMIK